jgi:hypothetical protein
MPLTRAEARKIALATPGASEGLYFGKPAIFLGEDYLCRVHDKEAAVVLRTGSMEMREVMLEAEPKLFYITDHYKSFPVILARLEALDKKILKELLAARILRLQEKTKKKRPRRSGAKKTTKKNHRSS